MDAESLAELALSIKEQGIMQPILVRPVDGGRFEIVAGERRWRAAQQAGLREIPALVKNVPDHAALAVALIENIQREDLNPLEEARGLQRLIDEFGLTHDAAAKAVGRSRSAVSNLLRLHRAGAARAGISAGGRARDGPRARAACRSPVAQQSGAAARVVERPLSVRETERLVHGLLNPAKRAARRKGKPAYDADTARLENDLADKLGAVVHIEPGRQGAGRITIRYSSLDQLDGIVERLGLVKA